MEAFLISTVAGLTGALLSFVFARRSGLLPAQQTLLLTYKDTIAAMNARLSEMERETERCREAAASLAHELEGLQTTIKLQAKEIARLKQLHSREHPDA